MTENCAHKKIQSFGGVEKITFTNDVIALKNIAGFVAGHLHGSTPVDSDTNEFLSRRPKILRREAVKEV